VLTQHSGYFDRSYGAPNSMIQRHVFQHRSTTLWCFFVLFYSISRSIPGGFF